MRVILLSFILFASSPVFSQHEEHWEDAVLKWLDAEELESRSIEDSYDILSALAEHPLNINQVTREELEQLPFLTDLQVEEIMAYINRYGMIRSAGELQMLTTLDAERRRLLRFFIYFGEPERPNRTLRIDSILQHSHKQLLVTGNIPFYNRKGDINGYLGPKYRHSFRFVLNHHERVKIGLTGAQDAGEPFFSNRNRWGYDHYSYFLQIKSLGAIEQLNLGMYRVQLGMGLVMNGGFYLGKLVTLQTMGRSSAMLRPHSSRSSQDYLQGIATILRLHQRWELTTFASFRYLDATLNNDGTPRTLLTSGYHRTPTEMSKKNNISETDIGVALGYRKGTFFAHANMLYTRFNQPLRPLKNTLYRRYAAEGNNFLNISIDYGYSNSHLSFSGETAINRERAIATINRLSYRFSSRLNVLLLHRYYDKKYTAHHAQSFSEGTAVQNEHGVYAGVSWQPTYGMTVNWYADYVHFPFARYQVSLPSDAFDTMIQASLAINNIWNIEGRYRLHIRQKDNEEKTFLLNQTEHRSRLRIVGHLPCGLTMQSQLDGIITSFKEKHTGWMLSQQLTYQWHWLQLMGNFSYFHTDNYDSRLYLYESPLLYEYSSLMLYGKGIRYALRFRADIMRRFMFTAKLGITNYFDRSSISSGMQEVFASSMTDLAVQLVYKF